MKYSETIQGLQEDAVDSLTEELTGKDIIDELKGRIRNIRVSLMSGVVNEDFKAVLRTRELALQSILSWIVGQNQLREEERYRQKQFDLYGNQTERTTT